MQEVRKTGESEGPCRGRVRAPARGPLPESRGTLNLRARARRRGAGLPLLTRGFPVSGTRPWGRVADRNLEGIEVVPVRGHRRAWQEAKVLGVPCALDGQRFDEVRHKPQRQDPLHVSVHVPLVLVVARWAAFVLLLQ